jgi:hypothetical protein
VSYAILSSGGATYELISQGTYRANKSGPFGSHKSLICTFKLEDL